MIDTIKAIPVNQINKLYQIFEEILNDKSKEHLGNIQKLNLKKDLSKYLELGGVQTNSDYCVHSIDDKNELPNWLKSLVLQSYLDAQNAILK